MKEIKEIKNIYICLDTIEDNQIIKKILVEFMDDSKSYFMLSDRYYKNNFKKQDKLYHEFEKEIEPYINKTLETDYESGPSKLIMVDKNDEKLNNYVEECITDIDKKLTIASENAKFGQTGPRVGSFDAGYGAGYLARMIGHKRAREVWFLCRQYTAAQAYEMGMVNTVVPFDQLEEETVKWCQEILQLSPMALRMLKASFNADTDGLAGLQQFAGDATLMYYTTDEAKEGRDAFKEKRKPDFKQFPKFP